VRTTSIVFSMGLRAREGPAGDSDDVLLPGLLPLGDGRTPLDSGGVHLHGVIGSPSHRKEERGHVGPRPRKVRRDQDAVHPGAHEP
jgi:hypothetical protein